jgi:hypothetical protein
LELILAGGASPGSPIRGFRNRRPQPESLSRRRFDPQARVYCRIVSEIRHGPETAALSGYWEPVALSTLAARLGVLGTARDGPRRLRLGVSATGSLGVLGTGFYGRRARRLHAPIGGSGTAAHGVFGTPFRGSRNRIAGFQEPTRWKSSAIPSLARLIHSP